jgi:murein L,D-transpeptidase YcbB/YkuD
VKIEDVCKVNVASNTGPPAALIFVRACSMLSSIPLRVPPEVGKAIASFYSANPNFIWTEEGNLNAKARAAMAKLAASDQVGLSSADYRVAAPDLHSEGGDARAQMMMRFELELSAKVLTYVLDTNRGRVDPNRISGYHDLPRKAVDLVAALRELADSTDIAGYLAQQSPDNMQFRVLAAELQKPNHSAGKAAKIRLALERLRWLPRKLGDRYVLLNQPAFEVIYVDGQVERLTMRAIIGKASAQTYFFTDHIKSVEYNPYWNVPRSIVVNEMLPHLYRNPLYLDRLGYEVTNARGREVSSSEVDWSGVARDTVAVDVRQPPGRENALGRLKIQFPNKHAIYMHDTPNKELFERERRTFSHGCVRLQHPREMAAALLGTGKAYIEGKIARGDNKTEPVPGNIPVYLAYFTAWPDLGGDVHYYDDIYKRDEYLTRALEKTEAARRVGH